MEKGRIHQIEMKDRKNLKKRINRAQSTGSQYKWICYVQNCKNGKYIEEKTDRQRCRAD